MQPKDFDEEIRDSAEKVEKRRRRREKVENRLKVLHTTPASLGRLTPGVSVFPRLTPSNRLFFVEDTQKKKGFVSVSIFVIRKGLET